MVGSLILLAAAMTQAMPASHGSGSSNFRPGSSVSAHATARIMIISGVKFGQDYSAVPPSATRRSTLLIDYNGTVSSAELLEFQ
jgi:hypothetical protein